MNLWICKIGGQPFTQTDQEHVRHVAKAFLPLDENVLTTFDAGPYSYVSVSSRFEPDQVQYHHERDGVLHAFAGCVTPKQGRVNFSRAENIARNWDRVHFDLNGSYSLLRITANRLECLVDPVGDYKVHYFIDQTTGEVFFSNEDSLLARFKERKVNYDWYAAKITMGFDMGCETDDSEVSILPEFGRILHDPSGLDISPYRRFEDIFDYPPSHDDNMDLAVSEMRSAARHFLRHHYVLSFLSGGFDSRLILMTFDNFPLTNENFITATYESGLGSRDLNISRKVAKYYSVRNIPMPLDFDNLPTLDQFLADNDEWQLPCRPLGQIFPEYSEPAEMENIYRNPLTMSMSGRVGGIEPFTQTSLQAKTIPSEEFLLDYQTQSEFLLPEYARDFRERKLAYLNDKYRNVDKSRVGDLYFMQEYIRSNAPSRIERKRVAYYPFFNLSYLHAVFSRDHASRLKHAPNSFYKDFAQRISRRKIPRIEFTDFYKWNSTALDRKILKIKKHHWEKRVRKPKIESQIRVRFLQKNSSEMQKMLREHLDSDLFKRIDPKPVLRAIKDEEDLKRNFVLVSYLIPILRHIES